MADSKKYDGSQWVHSLRKLTTATEAVENPLYSDGTAITSYTIKGNTVQNGTPTPSNPISVQGVGEKSENLFDGSYTDGYIGGDTGTRYSTSSAAKTAIVKCEPNTTYTIKKIASSNRFTIATSSSYPQDSDIVNVLFNSTTETTATITTPADASYLLIYVSTSSEQATPDMMLNTGSEALPYEPYGYKIPISSDDVTTNIYLGSTQTTRKIRKLVLTGAEDWIYEEPFNRFNISVADFASIGLRLTPFVSNAFGSISDGRELDDVPDNSIYSNVSVPPGNQKIYFKCTTYSSLRDWKSYLAQQYAAGTPVTIWYILAELTTGIINEPLMKIGDYADTLSNATAIPTTEGANSITVDTTVQPSEFTATWTGWHNAEVKEKSENLFDEQYPDISTTTVYRPVYVGNGTFTMSSTVGREDTSAVLYFLAGNVSTGAHNSTNSVYDGQNRTQTAVDGYVTVAYRRINTLSPENYDTMLNTGSTALPYEPYWK